MELQSWDFKGQTYIDLIEWAVYRICISISDLLYARI
jgi:hypothetical protein